MHEQVATALAHPVFDPQTLIATGTGGKFFWRPERLISAGLTCNLGLE